MLTSEIVVKKVKRFFSWNEIVEQSVNYSFCCIIVGIDVIHESVMQDTDTDDYKSKRRTKDTERKHLKRKKAKENQIPKLANNLRPHNIIEKKSRKC